MSLKTHSQIYPCGSRMTKQKVKDPCDDQQEASSFSYTLHDVDARHTHFKEIVEDFKDVNLTVLKIQRLENIMKWKAYKTNRTLMLEHRLSLDPSFNIQEKYLYHGTTANLCDICEVGLDDKLSRQGRFGRGIYFSDNPRKCVKYTTKKGASGLILCVRVILGDVKVYPKRTQDPSLLREPEKVIPFTGWRFFDSVEGCPKDYTEFVVYRAQNAFVEYLIRYSQSPLEQKHLLTASHLSDRLIVKSPDQTPSVLPQKQSPTLLTTKEKYSVDFGTETSSDDESSDEDEHDEDDSDSSESLFDEAKYEDTRVSRKSVGSNSKIDTSTSRDNSDLKTPDQFLREVGGEQYLRKKRIEFSQRTGEHNEFLVETFLLDADFDVDEASIRYHEKNNEYFKMNKSISEDKDSEAKREDATVDTRSVFVQGKTVPNYNSEEWKSMSYADREAMINVLIDNFLTVTSLSKEDEAEARRLLVGASYNLDEAIVNYYDTC